MNKNDRESRLLQQFSVDCTKIKYEIQFIGMQRFINLFRLGQVTRTSLYNVFICI